MRLPFFGGWQVPMLLIAAIYLPASIFGLIFLHDQDAVSFFVVLLVFFAVYVLSYGFLSSFYLALARKASRVLNVPSRCWYGFSFLAFFIYAASQAYAVYLLGSSPAMVALQGGSLMDIAYARSQFLAGLEGYESLLRYSVFILGRSIMPLVLVAAFMNKFRYRYLLLCLLLAMSMLSLEKAAPIFVFLPLVVYFYVQRQWGRSLMVSAIMGTSIVVMGFLAMGGLAGDKRESSPVSTAPPSQHLMVPPGMPIQKAMGPSRRFYLSNVIIGDLEPQSSEPNVEAVPGQVLINLANRIIWVPYITAYDWLGFHRLVLDGKLTMGRSISFIHHLHGQPKMLLEKMVYVYEFGPSPGGEGGSNTVFFVDAKLAFGWIGVIVYCLIYTFWAACIFSSGSRVLMVSSIVCFLIASISSLTATLLSGGMFIYVVLAFLLFRDGPAVQVVDSPRNLQ